MSSDDSGLQQVYQKLRPRLARSFFLSLSSLRLILRRRPSSERTSFRRMRRCPEGARSARLDMAAGGVSLN